MDFEVPPLPYSKDALGPAMSKETLANELTTGPRRKSRAKGRNKQPSSGTRLRKKPRSSTAPD